LSKFIREQLQVQTKEWLLERLFEFSADDDINSDRILLYLAAEKNDDLEVIKDFKSALDKAVEEVKVHGLATWNDPLPLGGLDNIADALAKVSVNGKHSVVLEISEYALLGLDLISELQDECELDYLIDAFRHLHLSACYNLKPDPEHFGIHLAELANKSEWGYFDGPPDGYTEVLGQAGLSSYASALKIK
jgi:hypothetical protein